MTTNLTTCVRNVLADGKSPDYLAVAMLLDCLEAAGDGRRDKVLEMVGSALGDVPEIGRVAHTYLTVTDFTEGIPRTTVEVSDRNYNRRMIHEHFLLRLRLLFWLELEGVEALRRLQEATRMEVET